MTEAPKVYCPKEGKDVPIWHCLGSPTQGRDACPELIEAMVNMREGTATVKCKAQQEVTGDR